MFLVPFVRCTLELLFYIFDDQRCDCCFLFPLPMVTMWYTCAGIRRSRSGRSFVFQARLRLGSKCAFYCQKLQFTAILCKNTRSRRRAPSAVTHSALVTAAYVKPMSHP